MPKTNNLVVFGNPPYQQQSEGQKLRTTAKEQAKPIYHLFVEAVIDNLNPRYLSFITPSKWMGSGRGLSDYRERMSKDKRIKSVKHFENSKDVFKEVEVAGGISYFLWDREYDGKCNFNNMHRYLSEYDIIVTDNKAVSILDKVISTHSKFLNETCSSQIPFGVVTTFKDWRESGTVCYCQGKTKKFIDKSHFTDPNNLLSHWKVCTSKANGAAQKDTGSGKRVIADAFVVEPDAICTQTFLVVNIFKSRIEAENFVPYMKTKFFRFLLGLRVITQNIVKESFAFVPDLGDYSKPVTDADLYKRFGLNQEEIAYIESKIKTGIRGKSNGTDKVKRTSIQLRRGFHA